MESTVLSSLFLAFVFVLLTSSAFSAALWRLHGDRHYRLIFFYWMGNTVFYFVGAVTYPKLPLIWEPAINYLGLGLLIHPVLLSIAYSVYGRRPPLRRYYTIAVPYSALIAVSPLILDDFKSASLLTIGMPLIVIYYVAVLQLRAAPELGQRGKFLATTLNVLIVVQMLHQIDYAFLREIEWFAPYGFAIYLGITTAQAIVFPAIMVHLDRVGYERKLEQTVEERTRQLRESQAQMVEAVKWKALADMAVGVAHEINNPLTAIAIKAQYLKRTQPESAHRSFDAILGSVGRIARITDALHHLATPEAVSEGTSDASDGLQTALELWRERLRSSGIELEVRGSREHGPSALPEQDLAKLILILLTNSVEALRGTPTWRKRIVLEIDDSPRELQVAIEDTGPGIPVGLRTRVFEPFFTTKPYGSEPGLGLSIARGAVESAGGRIGYVERPGGARFEISIPR